MQHSACFSRKLHDLVWVRKHIYTVLEFMSFVCCDSLEKFKGEKLFFPHIRLSLNYDIHSWVNTTCMNVRRASTMNTLSCVPLGKVNQLFGWNSTEQVNFTEMLLGSEATQVESLAICEYSWNLSSCHTLIFRSTGQRSWSILKKCTRLKSNMKCQWG